MEFAPPSESLVSVLWDTLWLWQARAAQRAKLAGLEDRALKDFGVSRAEADHEAAKPFWRD